MIVADPRNIELARLADHWLPLRPGSNVALLNGLAHVIIRDRLHDADFIAARTDHFEAFAESVRAYTPERVAMLTGVPAARTGSGRAAVCPGGSGHDPLRAGRDRAHDGSLGVMGCANLALLDRQRRPQGRRRQSLARPEQRPRRLRHGGPAERAARLPVGRRPADSRQVREGLGLHVAVPQGAEVHRSLAIMPGASACGQLTSSATTRPQTDPHSQRDRRGPAIPGLSRGQRNLPYADRAACPRRPACRRFAEKDGTFINADRQRATRA